MSVSGLLSTLRDVEGVMGSFVVDLLGHAHAPQRSGHDSFLPLPIPRGTEVLVTLVVFVPARGARFIG